MIMVRPDALSSKFDPAVQLSRANVAMKMLMVMVRSKGEELQSWFRFGIGFFRKTDVPRQSQPKCNVNLL